VTSKTMDRRSESRSGRNFIFTKTSNHQPSTIKKRKNSWPTPLLTT
jgi:hypothetical protein